MKKLKLKNNSLNNIFMWFTLVVFTFLGLLFLFKNNILLFLIYFFVVFILSFKLNIKKFAVLLFVLSFFIRFVAVIALDFPQVTDAKTLLEAAELFSKNDFSFQNLPYFNLWGYQTGFVIYEGLILKLFSSPFALKVLNILFSSFIVLFVYYFSKKLSDDKTAKFVSFIYMVFPYHLYVNSLLLNHQLSTLLLFLSFYFLLKKEKHLKDYIFASIIISFSNIIRPEAIIVIFSFILFEIFNLSKSNWKNKLKYLIIFLTIYISLGSFSSFCIKELGINKSGLENKDPLWKFVLGFNHDSCGLYTDNDLIYLNNRQKEEKIIIERIFSNPLKTLNLFACKANKFWLPLDLFAKNDMYYNKVFSFKSIKIKFIDILNVVSGFNNCIYLFTLFMAIYGVFIKRKDIIKNFSMFFVILFTVCFFVFLLIEIQARYAYFIQIIIFILSCYGYCDIFKRLNKFLKERN